MNNNNNIKNEYNNNNIYNEDYSNIPVMVISI